MTRLSHMGVLSIDEIADDEGDLLGYRYEVSPSALPLIEEIASGHETPFSVLIAALLADETNATLDPLRAPLARHTAQSAAIATTRHARMVAHEIRNALVPVQAALDKLYREGERRGSEGLFEAHRDAIDQGIERVFRFIKEMMEVAERGAGTADVFDLAVAIQDAIAAVSSELGQSVTLHIVHAPPPVTGHRHRFTLAVVNLLRNAAQAVVGGPVQVRISVEVEDGGEALVLVEDNGPGVPAQHRSAIFELGFSLRPGGTGQGLALVREVIESEMGGRATCEDSPLGGARFVLKLPVTGRKVG